LLPLLRDYNPDIDGALLRAANIVTNDIAFLEEQISRIWDDVVCEQGEALVLDTRKFALLHPALQRYLLREVMRRLLGSLKDIEWRHIDSLMNALSLPAGKSLSLPGGLVLSMGYGQCIVGPESLAPCPFSPLENEWQLRVPGETVIPGWRVDATIIPRQPVEDNVPDMEADLDFSSVGSQLSVRGRRPGDRFQPLGMGQPKKLQDFMVDVKIPCSWRDRVPLVCSPGHIIWVVGWRIDDRVKVRNETETVLHLKFERSAG
jgi:tRNA(Ile)-lysidine synthase